MCSLYPKKISNSRIGEKRQRKLDYLLDCKGNPDQRWLLLQEQSFLNDNEWPNSGIYILWNAVQVPRYRSVR